MTDRTKTVMIYSLFVVVVALFIAGHYRRTHDPHTKAVFDCMARCADARP